MGPVNHPPMARMCVLGVVAGLAHAACSYQRDLNVRRPPVLDARASRAPRGQGPAARVVWVLVDGLRLDASREMPVLNRLRAGGVDVVARAEFPTFSGPNFVAQASGIEPAASGVRSNGYPGEVALDSVFRRAKMAGLGTAVLITDPAPSRTYASWIDATVVANPDPQPPPAQLVFMHIGYVDRAGHSFGAASTQYRDAVARADEAIGRVAGRLDPAREALVITSDHGHLDEGGHGGTERSVVRIPIVVWGAGVVHGRRAGRGRDVGPTIASLLGIGPLSHATGRPLVLGDAIACRQRAAARASLHDTGERWSDHVPLAIPIAVAVFLVLGAASGVERRPVLSSPTYSFVFGALLFITGTFSFSVANQTAVFGARLTLLSALAAVVQLRVGGRASLVPAALVASVVVLCTVVLAAHQTWAPSRGALLFLPIPALTGLAFICLMTAIAGRRSGVPAPAPTSRRLTEPRVLGATSRT